MIQDIKLEGGTLGRYKDLMAKVKEKRSELVGSMVTVDAKQFLEGVAEEHDRSLSYVASALLMRGIAACKRDGELFEPESVAGAAKRPATITVPTIELTGKGAKTKKRA